MSSRELGSYPKGMGWVSRPVANGLTLTNLTLYPRIKEHDPWCTANGKCPGCPIQGVGYAGATSLPANRH